MRWLLTLLFLLATGCAAPQIPTYPAMSLEEARPILLQQVPRQMTIQGQLTLSQPKQRITLDAAMVIRQPDELRLRAWKFGQAVFDLTVRPDGVYAFSGRREVDPGDLKRMSASISSWIQLLAPVPTEATPSAESQTQWFFERTIAGARVVSIVDRRTLVVTRHEMYEGTERRAQIDLSRYTMRGEIPWPGEILVREGDRRIRLTTSSLRATVTPRAFEPPRRAERITP
jgi:hypothetical protein